LYLATTTTACRTRRDSSGFELFEMLEHADHRVTRGRVRLVRNRTAKGDTELRAELALDEAIRAERLFRIVVVEIRFTARGGDPDGGESRGATAGLRDREVLDRRPETLANQRHGRQGNQTIVVVVRSTEDRACH